MQSDASISTEELVSLTAELVAAYVSNNAIQLADLPDFISTVHASLSGLGSAPAAAEPERPTPPVSIRKSVTPDYLISMEDGRRYKSLKRHLSGRGLTPSGYRAKWGLPLDYPMVAPNYAKQRSDLAKASGLGRKRTEPSAAAKPPRRR
jgi:predicted transcriptional regulator